MLRQKLLWSAGRAIERQDWRPSAAKGTGTKVEIFMFENESNPATRASLGSWFNLCILAGGNKDDCRFLPFFHVRGMPHTRWVDDEFARIQLDLRRHFCCSRRRIVIIRRCFCRCCPSFLDERHGAGNAKNHLGTVGVHFPRVVAFGALPIRCVPILRARKFRLNRAVAPKPRWTG
jgi:hypothetical protein